MDALTPIRIVLLAKTGSGKSSAGNVILGEKKFGASADSNSVTKNCQTEEGNINGLKITVTDTPGIFDTEESDTVLKDSTMSCFTECAPGPHVFILVLRVGRYTTEENESVQMILKWFGKEALDHTVVLFTHGDQLEENQSIKEFVERNKNLKELVGKCGGRVHVIDSKYWNEDPLKQLKKIMMEEREAGESHAVQTLEKIKQLLLEPRSSTNDQEPDQGSGRPTSSGGNLDKSEYRSNSFQIKQLLTTIKTMMTYSRGRYYTNQTLQDIADAIEMELNKIKEELEKKRENAEESEIRRQARESVKSKTLILLTGVTAGALLLALVGGRTSFALTLGILKVAGNV